MTKAEALLDAGAEIAVDAPHRRPGRTRAGVADGRSRSVAFAGADWKITIDDPNGFVDLNKADGKLLFGLLRQRSPDLTTTARNPRPYSRGARRSSRRFGTAKQASEREDQRDEAERPPAFMDIAQLRYVEGMTPGEL